MFFDLLNKLVGGSQQEKAEPVVEENPCFPLGDGFCWEFDEVPNGMGGYRTVDAYLRKTDDPTFRRCIVDHDGVIQNFPGFRDHDWKGQLKFPDDHRVRFAFWLSMGQDGRISVRWLLQPDGRYFADEDGFGADDCEEIEMYSWLDENGMFTEPFFRR